MDERLPTQSPVFTLSNFWRYVGLGPRMSIAYGSLLCVILITSFIVIDNFQKKGLSDALNERLNIGAQVFQRAMAQNSQLLTQSARVLAADFGFREAVASKDIATMQSALENQRHRINADLALIADLKGHIQTSTHSPNPTIMTVEDTHFSSLMLTAKNEGVATQVLSINKRWYQFVVVSVRAPTPIAFVGLGFVIEADNAKDMRTLIGMDIAFSERMNHEWHSSLTSIPSLANELSTIAIAPHPEPSELGEPTYQMAGSIYQGRAIALNPTEDRYAAFLLIAYDEIMAPYNALRKFLLLLAALSLAIAFVVSWWMARGIVQPVIRLQKAAERMAHGEYETPLQEYRQDEVGRLAATFNGMAQTIQKRESEVRFLAFNDALTELPNRLGFTDKVQEYGLHNDSGFSLLLIDIDRFKVINSTLGFQTADRILIMAAQRIQKKIPSNAVLARLVGDEFAVFLPESDHAKARLYAELINMTLRTPFSVANRVVDVRVTISFVNAPAHGSDANELIRAAEIALHVAKIKRLNLLSYDESLRPFRAEHLSLLGELTEAMRWSQLQLYFQPKLPFANAAERYAEVLIRWQHPVRGFISPIDFIPFAEQTGDIKLLTRWIVEKALTLSASWQKQGEHIHLSINISSHDLLDKSFARFFEVQLRQTSVPPEWFTLEITESSFVDNPELAMESLQLLHQLGVKLSIDDFGTGYSSLAYLRQMPVQELKIDQTFIRHLTEHNSDGAIVKSTIELGHNLGMKVVAEGAEEWHQIELLEQWGCDMIQGYYFSKPLDQANFLAFDKRLASAS